MINTDTYYIDLHGVLVDFIQAVEKLSRKDIYGSGEHLGDWDAPKKVIPNFFQLVESRDAKWWEEMPLYPNAHDILSHYGKNRIAICSAPWGNAAAYTGVKALVKKHFPKIPLIVTYDKHLLAHANTTLVDDKDENIDMFVRHGGNGILWPNKCNSLHHLTNKGYDFI